MSIALDSSAVLALLFGESGGGEVANTINEAILSSVNLAEIVTKLVESGYSDEEIEIAIDGFLPSVVPFDTAQAVETGKLRQETRKWGLSLGDRACLALAKRNSVRALTADRAWAEVDIGIDVKVIR